MKKIVLFVLSALLLSAPFAFADKNNKDKEEEQRIAKVAQAIDNKTFVIWVTTIVPQSAPSIQSGREYCIRVKDGVANGRLPFFGRSFTAVLGSDDSSIEIKDVPVTISRKTKGRRKQTVYTIEFKTEGTTKWECTATVWDNGNADIYCNSPSKTPMTYYGELDVDDSPQE